MPVTSTSDTARAHLFPRGLFGSQADTQKYATKLMRNLAKGKVPKDFDLVCWTNLGDVLQIGRMKHAEGLETDRVEEPSWRLYTIGRAYETFCRSIIDQGVNRSESSVALLDQRLLPLLDALWFTVAMLDAWTGVFWMPEWRREGLQLAAREYLQKYVRWLPEIERLAPHFRDSFMLPCFAHLPAREMWKDPIVRTAHWASPIPLPDGFGQGAGSLLEELKSVGLA